MREISISGSISSLIPSSIRGDQNLPWAEYVRAWAMVAVLIISILIPLAALIAFGFLQLITGLDFSNGFLTITAVIIALLVQHFYFQSYGNLRFTAAAYSVQALISYIISIYITDGWNSPVMLLLVCSPLIAFMTISYRAALIHTGLVFIAANTFLALDFHHIPTPNILPAENWDLTMIVIWAVTLTVLILFLYVCNLLSQGRK